MFSPPRNPHPLCVSNLNPHILFPVFSKYYILFPGFRNIWKSDQMNLKWNSIRFSCRENQFAICQKGISRLLPRIFHGLRFFLERHQFRLLPHLHLRWGTLPGCDARATPRVLLSRTASCWGAVWIWTVVWRRSTLMGNWCASVSAYEGLRGRAPCTRRVIRWNPRVASESEITKKKRSLFSMILCFGLNCGLKILKERHWLGKSIRMCKC